MICRVPLPGRPVTRGDAMALFIPEELLGGPEQILVNQNLDQQRDIICMANSLAETRVVSTYYDQ